MRRAVFTVGTRVAARITARTWLGERDFAATGRLEAAAPNEGSTQRPKRWCMPSHSGWTLFGVGV